MATPGMQNTRTMDAKTTKRGRPRKGQALRVPLTFSVDPATRQKAQELRNAGYALNDLVEGIILDAHATCFGRRELEPMAQTMAYIKHWKAAFADTE